MVPASGSTLAAAWTDPHRDGVLQLGPGEPLAPRTDLAPRSKIARVLASFVQITDAHVTDEESPARVEMLDRLGAPFTSAFRPQEALTPFVLAAVLRTVDRLHPAAVFETGDLVDNAQRNEFDQALAILRGGRVDPNSGAPGYDGVQEASNPDPLVYRPGVDAPVYPGLLDRAETAFHSPGLDAPWYPLPGNHDLLVQGNLPATARTQAIATGSNKLVSVNRRVVLAAERGRLSQRVVARLLADGLPGRSVRVPADPRRRELDPGQAVALLRSASGHGGRGPLMDGVVDLGPDVRAIMLDTTRRSGGAGGVLRRSQLAWLRRQLALAGDRWVLVVSTTPLSGTQGAAPAVRLLDRDPKLVAGIAGDVHRNSIRPRRTATGGYWLITTSSLADYPQQARAFQLCRTVDGRVALRTWMLNADPASPLANISRQLAYLDYQGGRPNGWAGRPGDRNAVLYR